MTKKENSDIISFIYNIINKNYLKQNDKIKLFRTKKNAIIFK
jgi:hypothetical protein